MAPPTGRIPGRGPRVEGREEKSEKGREVSDLPKDGAVSTERSIRAEDTEAWVAPDSALGKFFKDADPDSLLGKIVREFEAAGSESYFDESGRIRSWSSSAPTETPEARTIAAALGVYPESGLPRDTIPGLLYDSVAYVDSMRPTLPRELSVDWMIPSLTPQPLVALQLANRYTGKQEGVVVDPALDWRIRGEGRENGKPVFIEFSSFEGGTAKLTSEYTPGGLIESLFTIWREGGEYRVEFYRTEDLRFEGEQPRLIGGAFRVSAESHVREEHISYGFEPGKLYTIHMGDHVLQMQFPIES